MYRSIRNKRGEGDLLWYITYLSAAVLILGTIAFLGVDTFSTHSTTDQLHRAYIYEQALHTVFEQNLYTGKQTTRATNLNERLPQLDQEEDVFAIRVKIDGTSHYSNEETFNTLLTRIGTSSEITTKKYTLDKDVEISVVMRG